MQREIVAKIIADLKDKVKDHPLEVQSLELFSKLSRVYTVLLFSVPSRFCDICY